MKTFLLMRHGRYDRSDPSVEDFARPLNERGRRDGELVGRFLGDQGIPPALILCSAARRADETLDAVLHGLDADIPTSIEKDLFMAEAETLLWRLTRVDAGVPSVMVIGHNPGLQHLALGLAGAGGGEARQRLAGGYPTAALTRFSADIERWQDLHPGGARLEQFVQPGDLERE